MEFIQLMIRIKDFNIHVPLPVLLRMRGIDHLGYTVMVHPLHQCPIALSRTFPFQKPPTPLATRMSAAKIVVIA